MLSGLRLGNFKAFSETQHVPIRPLTLIFGPNSSGKSSLIHGLLLAHQAIKEGELDVHRPTIGGASVDLGGFRQYVHRRDAGLQVEWALEIPNKSYTERLKELLPKVDLITLGLTIGLGKFARSMLEKVGRFTPANLYESIIEAAREKGDQSLAQEFEKNLKDQKDFITLEDISKIEGDVHVETFWLDTGKSRLLSASYRTKGHLQLDFLDQEHEMIKYLVLSIIKNMTTTDEIDDKDRETLTEAVDELVPKFSFKVEKLFPVNLLKEKLEVATPRQIALSTIGKERRKEKLKEAIEYHLPGIIQEIVLGLSEIIENEISRLVYLGPLRSYPPRHIAFSQYHDPNWQAGGGYAWDTVLRNSRIRSLVNSWLGDTEKLATPYELKVKNLLTITDIESKLDELLNKSVGKFSENFSEYVDSGQDIFGELEDILSETPDQLKEFEQLFSNVPELILFDKRTKTEVSHRDVGIGISQVLPVLVTAYASSNKIIAIEQPEIHLHPALQAELGDVFIESALGENKNTFVIETHSEHLILRIMRRMRETAEGELKYGLPVNPNDVSILYVDQPKDKNYSVVYEMRLDKDGTLLDPWPGGFFEEGFKERFL